MKAGEIILERQRRANVRPILDEIDALRIGFGDERVKVLTPRVEIRLRQGELAQIPMKVKVENTDGVSYIFVFSRGYPDIQMDVELLGKDSESTAVFHSVLSSFLNNIRVDSIDHVQSIQLLKSLCNYKGISDCKSEVISIPEIEDENLDEHPFSSVDDRSHMYGTCRKCRFSIFNFNNISDHSSVSLMNGNDFDRNSKCTSIFLENAPDWIDTSGGEVQGKITCPSCSARLGLWSWVGSTCSCGEWVTPAIQINLSKIDKKVAPSPDSTKIA